MRRTVTPETWCADVRLIYEWVLHHPRVDRSNIVVFAHSEGGLSVARLIAKKLISPKGIIFAAGSGESPAGIMKWQCVERCVEQVLLWDRDGDGVVTAGDVETGYKTTTFFRDSRISVEELRPPGEAWSRPQLEEFFLCRYEKMKAEALATEDTDPYPPPSDEVKFVAASNRWWKQWFVDETPTIDLLRDYEGMISFHLGEIDSQTHGAREIAFAKARVSTHKSKPALVLHPGRGHAFRTGEP